MKVRIALFFIFLANIVILAHSAIPHHHWEESVDVCNISPHKKSSKHKQCPHNDTIKIQNNNTESHNGLTFEECLLDDINIRLADNDNYQITQSFNLESIILYIPIQILKHIFSNIEKNRDTYIKYIPPIYTSFISQTYSLRAPPSH